MNKPTYEELAAQVEVLRNHLGDARQTVGFLSHHLRGKLSDTALIELAGRADYWAGVLKDSPAACLAQVKADAVESAVKFFHPARDIDAEALQSYSERIRQGGGVMPAQEFQACARCGISGIHACLGVKQLMRKRKQAELKQAIALVVKSIKAKQQGGKE
jgi:hypothetical protein